MAWRSFSKTGWSRFISISHLKRPIRFVSLLNLFLVFILLIPSIPSHAYERIISLKPNLTEILFSLGVGDKLVGVTTYCDQPPEAKKIDRVADYLHPDLEKIASKKPDLIVGSQENSSRREIEFLIHQGYRVFLVETSTLAQLRESFLKLGAELGREAIAQEKVAEMDQILQSLQKKSVQNSSTLPKALFVVGRQPLIVAGSQNLFDEIAPYLGVRNVVHESRVRYPNYSLETLLAQAPEILFDFSMGSESNFRSEEALRWWSQFSSLPAVKNQKVFLMDVESLRAGPRLVTELKKIREKVEGK